MQEQTYYISKLKEVLSLRQKCNENYSLRAYARDLDLHSSTLSQVLKAKRALPFKKAISVARKLNLSPKEKTLFIESFFRQKTSIDNIEISKFDERFMLDEAFHKVISEWEHFAVLELFDLNKFKVNTESIARKLNIKTNRAEVVLSNLVESGLIQKDSKRSLVKTHSDIKTTEDISSQALKNSHKETLEMGIQKLEEIDIELRDFSSATLAMDLAKISEAKTIIREFRQKMAALLRDGNKTEVFQLAIQFFPLTDIKENKR